jgi:hypothetical protein
LASVLLTTSTLACVLVGSAELAVCDVAFADAADNEASAVASGTRTILLFFMRNPCPVPLNIHGVVAKSPATTADIEMMGLGRDEAR